MLIASVSVTTENSEGPVKKKKKTLAGPRRLLVEPTQVSVDFKTHRSTKHVASILIAEDSGPFKKQTAESLEHVETTRVLADLRMYS